MAIRLPILSQIAFNYIWLPISSCAVERSFSLYNTILDNDRQNLSKESFKQLNMMYLIKFFWDYTNKIIIEIIT